MKLMNVGTAIAARMPMMATTIISSTSVNPLLRRRGRIFEILPRFASQHREIAERLTHRYPTPSHRRAAREPCVGVRRELHHRRQKCSFPAWLWATREKQLLERVLAFARHLE